MENLRKLIAVIADIGGAATFIIAVILFLTGNLGLKAGILLLGATTLVIVMMLIGRRILSVDSRKPGLSSNLNIAQNTHEIDYIDGQLFDFLPTTKSLMKFLSIFMKEMKKWDKNAVYEVFGMHIWVTGCTPSYNFYFRGYSIAKRMEISMDYASDRDGLQGKPFKRFRSIKADDYRLERSKSTQNIPFFKLFKNWREIVAHVYAPIEHRKKETLNIGVSDGYALNVRAMDVDITFTRDDITYKASSKINPEFFSKIDDLVVTYDEL